MKKKIKIQTAAAAIVFLAVAYGSIRLPGVLLEQTVEAEIGQVQEIPSEYYLEAGRTMARNASENLSSLDRIKLITGVWESSMEKYDANSDEDGPFLTEPEAVKLARTQMEYYSDSGVRVGSVQMQYDGMYSYSSEVYRYTDTEFQTYSAYLWKITFTKYDNQKQTVVYMTESGTVLLIWTMAAPSASTANAETSEPQSSTSLTEVFKNIRLQEIFGDNVIYTSSVRAQDSSVQAVVSLPDAEQPDTDAESDVLVTVRTSGETIVFRAMLYDSENGYGFLFLPYEEP